MAQLLEWKQEHHAALKRAEAILATAESGQRGLTESESTDVDAAMAEAAALAPKIAAIEKRST